MEEYAEQSANDSLYQNPFTRKPNELLYTMKNLFNAEHLKTWEYKEFKNMVRSFCKEHHLYFDEEKEMIYKKEKKEK